MVVSALAFLGGVLLVQGFSVLPGPAWLLGCAVCAGILAWRRCWRWLWLPLGFVWAVAVAADRLEQRLPEALAGAEVAIEGWIADLPDQNAERARFDFLVAKSATPVPKKLRLSWYHAQQALKAGQHWVLTVRLKPPHGGLNPGAFDYERWLFTEGIGATGYVRAYPAPVLLAQDPPWRNINALRQIISDRLDASLPDSGLIKALTIGEGGGISQAQWEVFRKTGTIHLIVISGSHIGLIAGLVYFLVLKAWAWSGYLRCPPQLPAAWTAMVAGVGYAGLAGFSVPSQRAVVMLAVFMLAIIQQRPIRPFNALAAALLAVLLYDPLAVLAAGFWLSFLAVAVIVYALGGRLGKPGYLLEAGKINWATSLALSPLLLWSFQQISLCAPVANFIAVPVLGLLVVPMALLAVVLLFVYQDLAALLLVGLDYVLQGLYGVLQTIAAWPWAIFTHPKPPLWALGLALPGVAWLLAPRGMPSRWLGLLMLLPLATSEVEKPAFGELELTLLDVGQGLAVAVQTAEHWLIYDTGAKFSEDNDSGQSVLLPFLASRGATRLDAVVISHGDNDHIGGAESLLRTLPSQRVLTSVPEQLVAFRAEPCRAGQSWVWDGVSFELLSPDGQPFAKDNDNSCVLKISAPSGAVLLPGDIEQAAETRLVERYLDGLRAEVLLAPHHGSKTSSSVAFLRAVRPSVALIPAGYRNRFGHPSGQVLARYRENQINWLNTADSGAISLSFDKHVPVLQRFRETDGKYWNWRTSSLQ